jgi:hypothetical protein
MEHIKIKNGRESEFIQRANGNQKEDKVIQWLGHQVYKCFLFDIPRSSLQYPVEKPGYIF